MCISIYIYIYIHTYIYIYIYTYTHIHTYMRALEDRAPPLTHARAVRRRLVL